MAKKSRHPSNKRPSSQPVPGLAALLQQAAALAQQSQFQPAAHLYQQILQRWPDQPEALHALGLILHQSGNSEGALQLVGRAALIQPDNAAIHSNLGALLAGRGQTQAAMASYRRALQLDPALIQAHCNLANLLAGELQLEEAATHYRQAIQRAPAYAEAHSYLGNLLMEEGKLAEAEASCLQAVLLRPDLPAAHNNLGAVYRRWGKAWEAAAHYRQALALQPNFAEAHYNLALVLLQLGQFKPGWIEYEWRWRLASFAGVDPGFAQPRWDGSDPSGRTILLWAEQGLGDTIQFIRYAALLRARGARVLFRGPIALYPLLAGRPEIASLIDPQGPLPLFDLHAPLMSLPYLCRTELKTIPAPGPYLEVPATCGLSAQLQQQLTAKRGALKVGLVWSPKLFTPRHFSELGNALNNSERYCALKHFEPLLALANIQFFSLYKGERLGELEPYRERIVDLGSHFQDFGDTAWAIDKLDLVITVDTAVAHLAGALSKPVWILLPHLADWRWLAARSDSPWYPAARLFRQPTPGDWSAVVAQVIAAMQDGSIPR
ncbi:tetratricopeptide repeat protein [Gloeobacter kilaueensis]|uniref:TPR repeat-containing protein n=1 Tax=Gloeobacter kilaueensis (strain ATCC BAA-2537 / CCAP 1431/1 / ULC 316 / JS1) TaxID=1183438 RepID=U5QJC8_GLOK1|nr:tetratricopeptide repeat protein [Gloeobacter kilaueensis]AGY59087.1 TPR repeat-containing protein [Gloeobacter kilaueensis JS1]